jgi:hypothetical protein
MFRLTRPTFDDWNEVFLGTGGLKSYSTRIGGRKTILKSAPRALTSIPTHLHNTVHGSSESCAWTLSDELARAILASLTECSITQP